MTPFAPSRDDGRSDRRVIYELVEKAEPETVFAFDALEEALQSGLTIPVARSRVYAAVKQGNDTLLRERRRMLAVIPGVGYRVIRSDEHLPMAITRKSRAESQIMEGIKVLKNVRLDELSDIQRSLHAGQLMILDGVYRMTKASEKRHAEQESVIERLRHQQSEIAERLARIESESAA